MKITKNLPYLLCIGLFVSGIVAAQNNSAKDKKNIATETNQPAIQQAISTSVKETTKKGETKDIDRVIAIVNREIITERELNSRIDVVKEKFKQMKQAFPPEVALEKEMLEKLIDDSITYQEAVNYGSRVPEYELDGIISNMALQKKMSVEDMRTAIEKDGIKYNTFRNDLRREIIISRYKEREVDSKVKISDAEIDEFINTRVKPRSPNAPPANTPDTINLAQILIPIPTGASSAELNTLKAKAQTILDQANKEGDFVNYANQLSISDRSIRFENLGYRTADRLPQIFIDATNGLSSGKLVPKVVQSLAGFHILKVLDLKLNSATDKSGASNTESIFITQSEVNQLMLTAKEGTPKEDTIRKLKGFSDQIRAKTASFTDLAKKYSEDPNVSNNNGYMGWISPGQVPPEIDIALRRLNPGDVSDPFQTEFGWHIVQLLNRRQSEVTANQQKEFARASLRQIKLQKAYQDWISELRDNATIDLKPPYGIKNN
jgi:peptidyl-prolyl cis-trans isomerase SurA